MRRRRPSRSPRAARAAIVSPAPPNRLTRPKDLYSALAINSVVHMNTAFRIVSANRPPERGGRFRFVIGRTPDQSLDSVIQLMPHQPEPDAWIEIQLITGICN